MKAKSLEHANSVLFKNIHNQLKIPSELHLNEWIVNTNEEKAELFIFFKCVFNSKISKL